MKNLKLFCINVISILTILFSACDKPGKVDRLDPAFSNYNFMFNKEGGDTVIHALRDNWNFANAVTIDSIIHYFPHCEEVFVNTEPPNKVPGICSDEFLTVKYDNLNNSFQPVMIEGSWFKIIKNDATQVSIAVLPNNTDKNREVRLEPDQTGTALVISQSAE